MKRIKFTTVILLFLAAFNLTSCATDDEPVDPHIYDTVAPTVSTTVMTKVDIATAISGGTVLSDGNAEIISRGVVWSTSENPTIANSKTTDGMGTGAFISFLTGMSPGTIYYVRAYAINEAGVGYGNQITFTTTLTTQYATITTDSAITLATSAISGGEITVDGGTPVTARGVVWSTSQNPTLEDSKTTDGTGLGVFISTITGLTESTTYYVRAYATNSFGTAYGNQITFTTASSQTPPTVTTNTVSAITATTATCGGNVIIEGGSPITARGVVWATTSSPTILNFKTEDGTGVGTFTSSLTNLTANTTYYVRAYATNINGTAYGNQETFVTLN